MAPSPSDSGTVNVTATTTAGSADVKVSSASGLVVGDLVTIAGAGRDGTSFSARVIAIKGDVITLDSQVPLSVVDAKLSAQSLGTEVIGSEREAAPQGLLETVVEQVLRLFLNV